MSHSRRTHPRALLLAGLCALGGCLDDCEAGFESPTPGPGELGNGDFLYYCITDDDPACTGGPGVGDFPFKVALGGRFRLDYSWNDSERPPATLRSAAPDRLQVQGEIFTALAPGYTPVLALVSNSDVGDLIHIYAAQPDALAVQVDRVAYFEYTAVVGQELRFDAVARSGDDDLAGALDFTFAVDDPAVAELRDASGAHATIKMVAPGATKLRASLGALTREIDLIVEATGATDGGSSSSAGDSSGGDSTGASSSGGDSTGASSSGGDSTGTTGGAL